MSESKRCPAALGEHRCVLDAGHDVAYAGDYSNPSWVEPAIEATPHRIVIEWEVEEADHA